MIYDNEWREIHLPDRLSPGEAFNTWWLYSAHCHKWQAEDPQDRTVDLEEPSSRYLWSKHNA